MQQRKLKKHKKVTISKPSQTVWKPSQTVWTTKDRKGKKKEILFFEHRSATSLSGAIISFLQVPLYARGTRIRWQGRRRKVQNENKMKIYNKISRLARK